MSFVRNKRDEKRKIKLISTIDVRSSLNDNMASPTYTDAVSSVNHDLSSHEESEDDETSVLPSLPVVWKR